MIRKIKSFYRYTNRLYLQKWAMLKASKQLSDFKNISNPIFLIIVPGSLHIIEIFLRYVPQSIKLILILNGIDKWEQLWVRNAFLKYPYIKIDYKVKHDQVIDFLIDVFKEPFGLIDYDCLIFDNSYFNKMITIDKNSIVNAMFYYYNEQLNIEVPNTYFLFYNTPIILKIKKKYHVSSKVYRYHELSRKVRNRLQTIGIDESHLPEDYKRVFDTFKLIFALGLAEGFSANFIGKFPNFSKPNNKAYHIGAVYSNNNTSRLSLMRGSYFWRLCLENCKDQKLQEHYYQNYGDISSDMILEINPEFKNYQSTKEFVNYVKNFFN